jgi:hypothetical protein
MTKGYLNRVSTSFYTLYIVQTAGTNLFGNVYCCTVHFEVPFSFTQKNSLYQFNLKESKIYIKTLKTLQRGDVAACHNEVIY